MVYMMKINYECLPCLVNQVVKVSKIVGIENEERLYHHLFKYLSTLDFQLTNPEIIGAVFEYVKKQINNNDPYYDIRKSFNKMFLKKEKEFEKIIENTENSFYMALKYAIIANIIDFSPRNNNFDNISQFFNDMKNKALIIDHHLQLLADIKSSDTLLYIGDNCGEICLDKILIKKIKEINPKLQIFFATRGTAVVNDSIEEDGYFIGLDKYATIINNGDYSLGTVLKRTSEKFRKIYYQADMIIAKGQANYESLSDENENIYFLLITKCAVIAKYLNTDVNNLICMKKS